MKQSLGEWRRQAESIWTAKWQEKVYKGEKNWRSNKCRNCRNCRKAPRADSQWLCWQLQTGERMTVQPRDCIQKLPVGASTPLTAGMSADEGVACAEDSASWNPEPFAASLFDLFLKPCTKVYQTCKGPALARACWCISPLYWEKALQPWQTSGILSQPFLSRTKGLFHHGSLTSIQVVQEEWQHFPLETPSTFAAVLDSHWRSSLKVNFAHSTSSCFMIRSSILSLEDLMTHLGLSKDEVPPNPLV